LSWDNGLHDKTKHLAAIATLPLVYHDGPWEKFWRKTNTFAFRQNSANVTRSKMTRSDKEVRDVKIRELWFACYSQAEIAEQVGGTQQTVGEVLPEMDNCRFPAKLGQFDEIEDAIWEEEFVANPDAGLATFSSNFTPPLYNVTTRKDSTRSKARRTGRLRKRLLRRRPSRWRSMVKSEMEGKVELTMSTLLRVALAPTTRFAASPETGSTNRGGSFSGNGQLSLSAKTRPI